MRRLCVFCGSHAGTNPAYKGAAQLLGQNLAKEEIELVYGGGHVGLMGIVADSVLAEGGHVIGVIPESLVAKEIAHPSLKDLRVVKSMHERKALMAELSDGFIALPGGFGTAEEFCEIVTWLQLGFHRKPTALLNVDGYYDLLLQFFDRATADGFIKPPHRAMIQVYEDASMMLQNLKSYKHTAEDKWRLEKES